MQRRSQRIVSEERLPKSRRKFVDAAGRMLPDTLQHIDEILVRIDPVQSASDKQALHYTDEFCAEFGPAEHPVLFPERNGA